MNRFRHIIYLLVLAACSACTDHDDLIIPTDDDPIAVGEKIQFSVQTSQASTRSAKEDYFSGINQRYQEVQDDYLFTIDMYEDDDEPRKIASADYNPIRNTVDDVTTYDAYGTLEEATPEGGGAKQYLYWPSNVKKYAFHAISKNSSAAIADAATPGESDQSTAEKYFKRDLIEGFGFVPGWKGNENDGTSVREENDFNYMTTKEWYNANKAWGSPVGMTNAQLVEHWKKIPLFMHHKRSRITILLEAGEGVEREQIAFNEYTREHIAAEIYSYDENDIRTTVKPLLGSYECDYTPLITNDPENTVTTACYDAIVDPHNYADGTNMTEQKILFINLSGAKFSFYAANDAKYKSEADADNSDVETRYNLKAGQHLVLRVILSTDTRKILITAYVVDWKDYPFASICDDFGNSSKPVGIETKEQLIDMLSDPDKNKPGNVFVIIPDNFDLTDGGGWDPEEFELKATLKLAGAKVTTDNRLFKSIGPSGSISNGTIVITDKEGQNPDLDCAIAQENYGIIERLNVTTDATTRKATSAGLVTTNYGTIYFCSSQLPVYGQGDVFVGGIAAQMLYRKNADGTTDTSTLPIIDMCVVNARVDGDASAKGGGIVGKAEGKLTNNTFEYGITLLQDVERFKNIIYLKGDQDLEANGNAWCTNVANSIDGVTIENQRLPNERYDQVIDSQAELRAMLTSGTYNKPDGRIRIADSFTVDGDTWTLGLQSDDLGSTAGGNLKSLLNGNSKTITLTGQTYAKMLFSNIENKLYNLTLIVEKPIVATPATDEGATAENKLPARAPLAYSVTGNKGVLDNVKVKMGADAYVQATIPAGLVVWAYDGATIQDCKSDADVRISLPEGTGNNQQTYFVGGLVNTAAKANILRCTYHRQSLAPTEEANASTKGNIYYGGIVGGTNQKNETSAVNLHIADCTSWLTWENQGHTSWGGIIGYSRYKPSSSSVNITSMSGTCQGNYWAAPAGASPAGWAEGMNEEKVIGKKNSIAPDYEENY